MTFRIATFNVLGSSHTAGPGGLASGPERMRKIIDIVENNHVSVVGFQEMEADQVQAFVNLRGGSWGIYPGKELDWRAGTNSIVWRKDTWRVLHKGYRDVPYFDGRIRHVPLIVLQHLRTGQLAWFLNVHNPASVRKYGDQSRWRREAIRREINAINGTKSRSDIPIFFMGDLNDREKAFCPVAAHAHMRSANPGGRATRKSCSPPDHMFIDWIFGSWKARFSNYAQRDNHYISTATDHPLILADATVPVAQTVLRPGEY